LSNPLATSITPYYSNNYSVYQPGLIFPTNLDVITWPEGYGSDLTVTGPGILGTITAGQATSVVQADVGSLLPLLCPSPMMLPYKNCRKIYISFTDASWNASNITLTITGFTSAYKIERENIICPAVDKGILTTKDYQYITNIEFTVGGALALTSDIYFDYGYTGLTLPFTPDCKCSSWAASLQVSVDSANITYTPKFDNLPRDVQTNTRPSSSSSWVSDIVANFNYSFDVLDIMQVPVGGNPYPAIGPSSGSTLSPIPFPVQNVYLEITNATTTGSLIAIFLQDSIWFK
jgi:hypothetical protein